MKCSEKRLKINVIRGCSVKRNDVLNNFAKFTEKHLFRSLFFNKVSGRKSGTFGRSHRRCSIKQGALKNFANFTGNNLCWSLFLIICISGACNLIEVYSDTGNFL